MTDKNNILTIVENEYNQLQDLSGSKAMNKVARRVYASLPDEDDQLIELFDFLLSKREWKIFWLITQWIKRKELYQHEFMTYYENWLYNYVDSWGSCDIFCYRVLNPMVERYPELFKKVMEWTDSDKTYVRRAAPVSLLESTRSFKVNYRIEKVFEVSDKLKHDSEIHVQKGVGWLLKYAYLSYPNHIYNYLIDNVDNLPRVIFRYALEKVPDEVRQEMMKL